jgi:cobalamin-dependent methionine synthase I
MQPLHIIVLFTFLKRVARVFDIMTNKGFRPRKPETYTYAQDDFRAFQIRNELLKDILRREERILKLKKDLVKIQSDEKWRKITQVKPKFAKFTNKDWDVYQNRKNRKAISVARYGSYAKKWKSTPKADPQAKAARLRKAFSKKGLYDFNPYIDYYKHSYYRVNQK